MKNTFFKSNYLTFCLLVVIVALLAIFLLSLISTRIYKKIDTLTSSINISQESLLPDNYSRQTILHTSGIEDKSKPVTYKSKSKSSIISMDSPKPPADIPAEFSSTVEGRDLDRKILIKLIALRISEYNFIYSKFPILYGDKSSTKLSDEQSEFIYFYNQDENRINALGISVISNTYLFREVRTCMENSSQMESINITYKPDQSYIYLCLENGGSEEYILF